MNTLKEQNGRYYQECKVVMVATDNKTNITKIYLDADKTKSVLRTNKTVNDNYKEYINLYITSNEEIKEGDWFISAGKIHQYKGDKLPLIVRCDFRKIIATTDESLEPINLYGNSGLFKPSDSFISKYIEEYNKGNIISDVLLVEYEQCKVCQGTKRHIVSMFGEVDCNYCQKNEGYEKLYIEPRLKVDSNNTITIKKVKDSYSREEVINLLYKYNDGIIDRYSQLTNKDLDKWIKENL